MKSTTYNLKHLIRWVVCAIICSVIAQEAVCESANNIRIVTLLTLPSIIPKLDSLKAHHELCLRAKDMPPADFPKIITEEFLAHTNGARTIKMFSGPAQAEFTEITLISIDMEDRCRVMQESQYTASVQIDCKIRWDGSSSKQSTAKARITATNKSVCFMSNTPQTTKDALQFAKSIQVGEIPCLILEALQNSPVTFCLYGKHPFYMDNPARMVSFETGRFVQYSDIAMESTLEELKDGEFTFPAQQFTQQAVLDWIKQPISREIK